MQSDTTQICASTCLISFCSKTYLPAQRVWSWSLDEVLSIHHFYINALCHSIFIPLLSFIGPLARRWVRYIRTTHTYQYYSIDSYACHRQARGARIRTQRTGLYDPCQRAPCLPTANNKPVSCFVYSVLFDVRYYTFLGDAILGIYGGKGACITITHHCPYQ